MYQSPFHILHETEINQAFLEDKEALRRLRKKLLAEFDLQQKNEVLLGNRTYTKDDILKAIDTLMENMDFELHSFIYSHKVLLAFLESDGTEYQTEDFKSLIVPESIKTKLDNLFGSAYCSLLFKELKQNNFLKAKQLLLDFPPWLEDEKEKLFETLFKYLELLGEEVNTVRETDINNMPQRLRFFMKYELAQFLNALPPELDEHKDSLIIDIINTLVKYSRLETCDGLYAYKVSVVLTNVNCSAELMDLIKSNHSFFTINRIKNSDTSSAGRIETNTDVPRAVYLLIAFVVVLLIGLNTNKNKSDYSYPNASQLKSNDSEPYMASIALLPNVQYYNFSLFHDYYTSKHKKTFLPTDLRVMEIYEIDAANSPFKILTPSKPENMMITGDVQKVMLENQSGFNLIVFSIDSLMSWSKYIAKGEKGTLKYLPNQRLYFYFGDSLLTCNNCQVTNDFFIKPENENHFAVFPDSARAIFSRKYHIVTAGKKSGTKATATPTLIIQPSFFRKDSVIGKKISLKRW